MFSRDSDNKLLPAAALASEHSKGTSSIAITALMEEKVNTKGFKM
jgi:E3 ubiquitin-protein ligase RBBP6